MSKSERNSFTRIEIPKSLGLSQDMTIEIGNTDSGTPKPLIGFDYDGTLVDSSTVYHLAAQEIVLTYTDDLRRVPTLEDFQGGVFPDFYAWGVSRKVPIDDIWDIFNGIVVRIEQRSPSKFFEGVIGQIQDISTKFHIVVVTLNSIHPVSSVIKSATGVDVDTFVVEDKTLILRHLAKWHKMHHCVSDIPFYYFGDSINDMKASLASWNLIHPVAVSRRESLSCKNTRRRWVDRMRGSGARTFVSHPRMIDVVNGMARLDGAILI